MRGTILSVAALVTTTVLGVVPATGAPGSGAVVERRPGAEEATAVAVNHLTERGAGYRLRHPRRVVDFSAEGVRVEGRRGAPEWTWTLDRIGSSTGEVLLEGTPVAPVAVEETLIRYDRCVLLEEYRLKQDSVEQLLVIPEPLPLGGADLVVTGRVSCEGELAEDDAGWRWRGRRGEVTMGRVTVFDAEGKVLPARLQVTAASTRLVVDGGALLTAAYPVVVDPELGSNDYRISDMGGVGDWHYRARDAAVAYNSVDDEYLVVWWGEDNVGGLVEGEYEVFGQLVSATGIEVMYNDFRISDVGGTGNASYGAFLPDVAFNSTSAEYLVVWSADDPEDGVVDEELEIWGQLLDANGNDLLANDFRISFNGGSGDAEYDAKNPAVVYNPNLDEYLVVWEGDHNAGGMVDGEFEIWAQRVSSAGILVGSNMRMSDMGGTGTTSSQAWFPDVAYNSRDREYLIVWCGDDNVGGLADNELEIFVQLVDEALVGVGPNDYRISDMGGTGDAAFSASHPAATYNSLRNEYLVVWRGDDNVGGVVDNEVEVFSQRLDADLNGLGPNDFRLSDVGGVGDPTYTVWWGPDVAYSPTLDQYMVVWAGEDNVGGMVNGELEVFAQMLTGDAATGVGPNDERVSDAGGIGNSSFAAMFPVVAANTSNGEFLVAWYGEDNVGGLVLAESEVFIQRMDGMAVFVDTFESGDTGRWSSGVP